MRDNVALGGRYGVLRVQPQEPTPRYYHRNGETDEPQITGWYWFDGAGAWRGKSAPTLRRPVFVERDEEEGGAVIWYGADDEADDACADGWLRGQWWGPVVPPWSEGNG